MGDRAAGAYLDTDPNRGDTVAIRLVVGDGPGAATAWGCDLSDQYVRINADYTT
jgi:glutamate N-acetyltransferase/amino-acid N-acetyltransferase